MRVFDELQVEEAEAHAAKGGVALHLHKICFEYSPKCFRQACWRRQECIAHLVDQDKERLRRKAKALGVQVICMERVDMPFQHIDLCGAPLKKLIQSHHKALIRQGKTAAAKKLRAILSKFPGCEGWVSDE